MKAVVRALFDLPDVQTHTDSGYLIVLLEDEFVGTLEVLDPAIG